ncbi:MAG: PKD domain-containing protein, partial [Actinobacteria bacterium]|nr:PKD domain-containing protein [Actinomycetota bacterium]
MIWLDTSFTRASLLTEAPTAGETTTLSASGSLDPDGKIERLEWDFNSDGQVDAIRTDVSKSVAVQFMRAASYTVSLTVVDDDGLPALRCIGARSTREVLRRVQRADVVRRRRDGEGVAVDQKGDAHADARRQQRRGQSRHGLEGGHQIERLVRES